MTLIKIQLKYRAENLLQNELILIDSDTDTDSDNDTLIVICKRGIYNRIE